MKNIEDNLTADDRLPFGMNRKGATLKFGSSLCRKAEPSSSITYLKNTQKTCAVQVVYRWEKLI